MQMTEALLFSKKGTSILASQTDTPSSVLPNRYMGDSITGKLYLFVLAQKFAGSSGVGVKLQSSPDGSGNWTTLVDYGKRKPDKNGLLIGEYLPARLGNYLRLAYTTAEGVTATVVAGLNFGTPLEFDNAWIDPSLGVAPADPDAS